MNERYESNSDHIHILVVDDEKAIRDTLQIMIKHVGYECSIAGSGREALEILEKKNVDVVITDIRMAGLSGIELVGIIKEKYHSNVIVMTGYVEDFAYEKIIEQGASDFVEKPISYKELIIRLKRVLRERALLSDRNRAHKELKAAHQELQGAYLDTINRLVLAAEYKDKDTGDHIVRMSRYSALIAEKLGLPAEDVRTILFSAPMHDIGKIGIPDSILLKPGKLTDKEFKMMKTHTIIGAKILANSEAKILRFAHQIAISHHEKWNGKGYPQGLSGDNIPLIDRIVSLADTFDALTSLRPYKDPYPIEVSLDIIKKERGEHFDPEIVDIFLENIEEILKIKEGVSSHQDISLTEFLWSGKDNKDKT